MGPYPLGGAPLGSNPQTFATPYRPGAPPAAIRLDLLNRDATLDEDGRHEDMGTIEQQVALAFSCARGTLKHAPLVGHDFFDIGRMSRARQDAAFARAAVRATPFDRLLRDGLVEFLSIETTHPKSTEARFVIRWRKTGAARVETTPVGS